MDTKQLTEDWLASNAIASFAAVLLIGQILGIPEGEVKFLGLILPDLPWLIFFGFMAGLFMTSLLLAVASIVPKFQRTASDLFRTFSAGIAILNWLGFTLGWLTAVSNMPLDQWWSWILFVGGVFFTIFLYVRFFRGLRSPAEEQ